LQTILDHMPIGVVLVEAGSSRPVLGNAGLERILGKRLDKGVTRDELPTSYRFVHPGTERTLTPEELPSQRAVRGKSMVVAEVDILHSDNERVRTDSIAVPILDESGAVKKVIVLVIDVTARKDAEEERVRLQEEVIRFQAAALTERSSPLIPITDEILVLPLIGSIDTERGHQVLDTVLHGTSQRGARVAIIDITGVHTIDTHAAATLTAAAQALRLVGVEPVLTGIRAEVAQTMVGLGVHLDGITTRSTLQAGIQYALRRLGKNASLSY
jgi:rsbT co-antagonist protein RsbR